MYDVQNLLQCFLYLVLIILGGGLLWLIKVKIGDSAFEKLVNWVDVAITAAEEQIKGEKKGAERKTEVMDKLLATTKVDDVAALSDLVDSRVYKVINKDKVNTAKTAKEEAGEE